MWTLAHISDPQENPCPAGMIQLGDVEFEGEILDGTEHECNKEDTHDDQHVCECGFEWPS